MIKLLLLCLLATLVTMHQEENLADKSAKSPTTTDPTSKETTKTITGSPSKETTKTTTGTPSKETTKTPSKETTKTTTGAPSKETTKTPSKETTQTTTGTPSKETTKTPSEETTKTTTGTPSKETTKTPSKETTKTTTGTPSKETTKTPSKETTPFQATSLTCHCNTGLCQDDHCSIKKSETCVTAAEENTLDGFSSDLIHTCWGNSDLCNTTFTITLNKDVYWRSSTTCCNKAANCNSHPLEVPQPSKTTSKRVCPSCFALNAFSCTPIYRNCTESENRCISITGTVKDGTKTTTFAGKGCATDSVLRIKKGTTMAFGNATYSFTVTDDSASQIPASVSFTFLLSSFVGLLQTKLIY